MKKQGELRSAPSEQGDYVFVAVKTIRWIVLTLRYNEVTVVTDNRKTVTGSITLFKSNKIEYASIAQLAEHAAVNWREGSTVLRTKSWSIEYEETRRIAKRSKRARRLCFRPVTGSVTWFKSNKIEYASIAQLAEHAAVNRGVTGSSPVWGAIKEG